MKEIGGYIELDQYRLPMMHDGAISLNCGRNCLAYLIRARKIKKMAIPFYLCDSVSDICASEGIEVHCYHINEHFMPENIFLGDDEWLYVVNYYGQITWQQIKKLKQKYERIIVDQSQAYFELPLPGIDTLYTCRKFFGVPDGAFLYTDVVLNETIPQDESFERMHFLLGRFERTASEFYSEYVSNNKLFASVPIKRMSKLTENLLHGIDYDVVKRRRTENFEYLHNRLCDINQLSLQKAHGAFAYPLLLKDGSILRKRLVEFKIYIPTLWPNVLSEVSENLLEYRMAKNILPIPCDQRYERIDMERVCEVLEKCLIYEN